MTTVPLVLKSYINPGCGASFLTSHHSPFLSFVLAQQKAFKDTSQYVVGELAALESEQRQIDTRASCVEKRLRYLMDTGTPPNYTVNSFGKLSVHKLLWSLGSVNLWSRDVGAAAGIWKGAVRMQGGSLGRRDKRAFMGADN